MRAHKPKLRSAAIVTLLLVNQLLFSLATLSFKFTPQVFEYSVKSSVSIREQIKLNFLTDIEFYYKKTDEQLKIDFLMDISIADLFLVPIQIGSLRSLTPIRGLFETGISKLSITKELTVKGTEIIPLSLLSLVLGPIKNSYLFLSLPNKSDPSLFSAFCHIFKSNNFQIEASIALVKVPEFKNDLYLLELANLRLTESLLGYLHFYKDFKLSREGSLELFFANRILYDRRASFHYTNSVSLKLNISSFEINYWQTHLGDFFGSLEEITTEKPIEKIELLSTYKYNKLKVSLNVESELFKKEIYASLGQKRSFKIENKTEFRIKEINLKLGCRYQESISATNKYSKSLSFSLLGEATIKEVIFALEPEFIFTKKFYFTMKLVLKGTLKENLSYELTFTKNREYAVATFKLNYKKEKEKMEVSLYDNKEYLINYSISR